MRCRDCVRLLTCCVLVAGWAPSALAAVKLPAVIGDNMVLQAGRPTIIWGWAEKSENVTVTFFGPTTPESPVQWRETLSTQADDSGRWRVVFTRVAAFDPKAAGKSLKMTVKGSSSRQITLKNILVGEVWVGSGQSNMQFTVAGSNNAAAEIAAANYPQIRLLSVPQKGTREPQHDFRGGWSECSPQTVGGFSAVAYFFGRTLHQELKVPIGVIHCSWGSSACEAWVKRSTLEAHPEYKGMLQEWDNRVANYDAKKVDEAWQKQLKVWKKQADEAKAAGKQPLPFPQHPVNPTANQFCPANCYNGMLLPLMPYAIHGAIWYQGETNAGRAYQYRQLFPLMIANWRADWGQGDFPFYFVQLANFMAVKDQPGDSAWAELREAQTMTLRTPNTGMAVTTDIGDASDIHPENKQDVGRRLALWALAKDYGQKLVYAGPLYRSMRKRDKQIVLRFDHVGSGLVAKDGDALKGFAIAGADKKFVWAEARIVGNTVVVGSPSVADPTAVRYAWADNPVCNLYNREGLPASPFRTDTWKGVTQP